MHHVTLLRFDPWYAHHTLLSIVIDLFALDASISSNHVEDTHMIDAESTLKSHPVNLPFSKDYLCTIQSP